MLTKAKVDEAIVQAYYMSGDRNTIASALKVSPRLGVLILVARGRRGDATELANFYKEVAGADRVGIYECLVKKGTDARAAVQQSYRWVDGFCHGTATYPDWIGRAVEKSVTLQSATYGTRVIAGAFQANASSAQREVRRLWRLDQVSTAGGVADFQDRVKHWLGNKGFTPNRAYVVLFAKKGGPRAEKAHHFTSILTWRILQERIERETNIVPVASGDDIGLRTIPTLVEFWKDEEWKKIFAGVDLDARSAQLGMWCFLAEHLRGISIVGMRSGMIEVPALLGIRTLYLEEKHNQQASRMARWIGPVPGFRRQVVERPAGINQQIYWREESLRRDTGTDVHKHAIAKGGHVRHMVMGFEKKDLGKKVVGTVDAGGVSRDEYGKAVAKAVFGSGGLAPTLSAQDFMLKSSEFDAIIDWIKQSPKPPKERVYGSVPGNLKVRDVVVGELHADRTQKTWSEYFASPEYRDRLEKLV